MGMSDLTDTDYSNRRKDFVGTHFRTASNAMIRLAVKILLNEAIIAAWLMIASKPPNVPCKRLSPSAFDDLDATAQPANPSKELPMNRTTPGPSVSLTDARHPRSENNLCKLL